MMELEVVRRRAWLTREEFLDLLGVVNLISGPSSTEMAILIGYRRARWVGLILGGTCFIVPAALLVVGCAWTYVRFGALPQVASLLYGVKPVVIAVILQALFGLGRSARTDVVTVLLACASAFLLLKFRLNSAWLVLAGALAGVGRWWLR